MVREPDATVRPTLQDNQLMSKHRVLSFKPQLRLEWRGQGGQNETEQPDHSASLGDSIASSTRIRFSVHTGPGGAGQYLRRPLSACFLDLGHYHCCVEFSLCLFARCGRAIEPRPETITPDASPSS